MGENQARDIIFPASDKCEGHDYYRVPDCEGTFGKRPKHTNIDQNCKKADTTRVCRMSQAEEKILNYLLIQGLE